MRFRSKSAARVKSPTSVLRASRRKESPYAIRRSTSHLHGSSRRSSPIAACFVRRMQMLSLPLQEVDLMFRMRLGIALLALCSPLMAANGNFHFGKVKFEPVDSFAFQLDTKDPGKPITVIALTSFKIDRAAVLAAIDPASALIMQTAEAGNVVFVRLVAPDRCGIAGYLASTGNQIDLGESFSAKSTASTASRIAGECASTKPGKMFEDAYDFRLPYDVAITA